MSENIEPFELSIPEAELTDLRDRLARTRWPEHETTLGWDQGVPLAKLKALCDYWQNGYDWRRCEAMLNRFGQFRTSLDGHGIHFLHIRSPEPDALPLIMTHGWPGSVIEFHKVIGPLNNPAAHGGERRDAFHLILPSMPGYGFSDKPTVSGCKIERIADLWIELMRRLGYTRWAAQGGDWGSAVTRAIGWKAPSDCVGIHLNMVMLTPTPAEVAAADATEKKIIADLARYHKEWSGYSKEQSTRPQTIGYALADSPAGQAGWIYEKFNDWTDHTGDPETLLSRDEILDNIMLYWLTNSAASSARLYWESFTETPPNTKVSLPTGISMFPRELMRCSHSWAESRFTNLAYFNELDRGGHFVAVEQPALFVNEVRAAFRAMQ